MKKVLVTGAGGYIGSHVLEELHKQKGITVIGVGRSVKDGQNLFSADIFSKSFFDKKQLQGLDTLIHLAWEDGFNHKSIKHISRLADHFCFLENAIKMGVKKIVVIGSMHEIGYWEGAVDESTPTNPLSLYGIAKNSLRQGLQLLVSDGEVMLQWLRCFYVYGDDTKNHSVFTKLLEMEARGEQYFPMTEGKNMYDFLHIKDLAEQIVAAAQQDKIDGIINCCSGKPVRLSTMVETFIANNQLKIRPKYGVYPTRKYDSPAIWGDAKKISKILSGKL